MSPLYMGVGLLVFAIAELTWAIRTSAPRFFAAQALGFLQLGMMALVNALIPDRTAATIVVALIGIGTIWSTIVQFRLLREWRTSLK